MKRIASLALCLFLCLTVLAGCAPSAQRAAREAALIPEGTRENDPNGTGYQPMAETADLRLDINPDTTAFRITVKQTGYVWESSVGSGADGGDQAMLSVSYMDASGVAHYMDTFNDSVKKGQFDITKTDKGVKIAYSLGEIAAAYYAPVILQEERYLRYTEGMSTADQRLMKQLYSLIDLNSYSGSDRQAMESKYPQAKEGRIYVLTPNMQKSIRLRLHEALKSVGYTEEDRVADAEYGGELVKNATPQFHLVIYLELDGDSLVVRVPTEELYYASAFPMETLRVLPNFGRTDQVGGYYLLPDGSGSIMEFRNGKGSLQEYAVRIYGEDRAVSASETTFKNKVAVFPVFGCALENGNGFLTVVEEGDALATVTASPGGDTVRPYAYASFAVLQQAKIETLSTNESGNSYFITHQSTPYKGEYRLRCHFLTGDDASYSGMAAWYRQQLLSGKQPLGTEGFPLYLSFLGEADVEKNILGVTVKEQMLLTSFDEAGTIAKELREQGVGDMQVILSGYLNGGYRQGFLDKASLSKQAGGSQDLRALTEQLQGLGISCSLEADVQYAYAKGLFGGVPGQSVSRLLSRKQGLLYPADPAYFIADTDKVPAYILNSTGIGKSMAGFSALLKKEGLTGAALRSVGRDLNSDYHEKREVERQSSLGLLIEQVAALREQVDSLTLSTGIAPFVPYADTILDLPLSSCNYDITDYSVPFASMVLSGYVRYSGGRANLDFADKRDLLRLLETGASPYFVLCGQNGSRLRSTEFNGFYAVEYAYVRERLLEDYRYVAEALQACGGQPIVSHARLADNVFETVYANGIHILVNYNRSDVTLADGRTIPAKDYLMERSDAS